jgi:hypothetical protein
MVKFVPATVIVAVRAAPLLAATVKVAVPLPDPPAETVTKAAELVAVQAQPVPAVTGTEPVPPVAPNDELVMAPTVTVHDGVVVAVLLLLSEHAAAMRNNTQTAQRRRADEGMEEPYIPAPMEASKGFPRVRIGAS